MQTNLTIRFTPTEVRSILLERAQDQDSRFQSFEADGFDITLSHAGATLKPAVILDEDEDEGEGEGVPAE